MEHQRRGTYIPNHVKIHACHLTSKHCTIVFELLQEKSLMRSSKIVEKERSIALMITKNRFWSLNKKKMRWTLPLGKSQRNEKINLAIGKPRVFKLCNQELSRRTKFSSPFPVIPSGLRQVSPILFTLVTSHSFHLGRSPITMRPTFFWVGHPLQRDQFSMFFFIWVGHPLQWDQSST
jgi:hypothetical protein